ncbi:MAG TPA: hypothetical protein VE665_09845 [Hyphomicrobiaceae bacterium]|jgi:hypothetical protein|nr:hypothetical protein [Hyphomicrobiaceae bacterium]
MSFHHSFAFMILVAAATASGPLAAQSYADPASGLTVDPPKPFVAQPGRRLRQFDATIDVDSAAEKRHCAIGYKQLSQNASLSKADINAMMADPNWRNLQKSIFEMTGTVTDLVTFEHQGYTGLEMTVTPKVGPAADTIRMSVSHIETPKGRTALICITDKDSLAAALPQFRAVRATIRAPE